MAVQSHFGINESPHFKSAKRGVSFSERGSRCSFILANISRNRPPGNG